jgi:hypothetical protein
VPYLADYQSRQRELDPHLFHVCVVVDLARPENNNPALPPVLEFLCRSTSKLPAIGGICFAGAVKMIGKNLMWCARQHGHCVRVMLSKYGVWIEGANSDDVDSIRRALEAEATGTKPRASWRPLISSASPRLS